MSETSWGRRKYRVTNWNAYNAALKARGYSLANMVPQDPAQNGKPSPQIEQDTRRYIRRTQGAVYVITGPVFSSSKPRTIGAGQVRVPDAVFKMVYDLFTHQR